MKKIYFLFSLVLTSFCANATVNFWVGVDLLSPNWSNPSNWANGVPTFNDTVFFDAVPAAVTVDVNPNIAGLQIINGSIVVFSSSATTLVTIGNLNVSGLLVFWVDKTSSFTIEGTQPTKGVSIQTFGNFTSTKALIEGSFIFGAFTCTWNVNSFPASFCTTNISGIVRVLATNTGSLISGGISNGNPGTVTFSGGSLLEWLRSGGSAPNANFADGSVISVKGIMGTNMNFNSSARYNGLLVWNCAAQTASGSSALLLPASNLVMDSLRIVSTGSGSVRMTTNPNGYTINSLEVNGGVLELGAPNSGINNLTDTITNEFKITGGTVLGNATFNFDNLGSAYPNTLLVKGSFVMTGGTLDYTNRNAGNAPGGAFAMQVKGNIAQTGGRIKATKGFDGQNLLTVNGTVPQQLQLNNITDTISLLINNANGVSLLGNLLLPYKLQLQSGYLQLNQYNATVAATRIVQAAATPRPSIVTNGIGKLVVSNVTGSQLFPIAPFAAGYNGLTISNSAAARTYSASVAFGVQPTGNIDILKTINRTWNISAGLPATDESTSLTFNYADSEVVAGATVIPAAAMVLGHFTTQWAYDPYTPTLPTGGPSLYTAGPFTPASLDSSFIIGNAGFISGTYIFTGTGNWTVPANWAGNTVPPTPLPAGNEIIIDPAGDCILNVQQTISQGARLKVSKNKSFLLPGNLTVQ